MKRINRGIKSSANGICPDKGVWEKSKTGIGEKEKYSRVNGRVGRNGKNKKGDYDQYKKRIEIKKMGMKT